MIEKTDQEIILNYLDGDEASLNILVKRYLKHIYNFVYHLCGNTEDAEDITSEIFIKVWKKINKYKPEQSFKIWIFSIAKNTTIDLLRKRKNLVFSDFDSEDGSNYLLDTLHEQTTLIDEIAMLAEEKKNILEKVLKLSPIHQTIIGMKHTEGFTFKEIGEILQKPVNTVKSHHRRALIELKKYFHE